MALREEPALYNDNVELYDIAFSWDIEHETTWLLNRLGSQCDSILEPGCGSGRMLKAIAQRGIEIVGLDSSKEGISLAKKHIAPWPNASAVLGDMTDFNLHRIFAGAICPINTLAILSPNELAAHFHCMSRHLPPNARYMTQVAIRNPSLRSASENSIEWESSRDEIRLRTKVWVLDADYKRMREMLAFKITVESGKRAGEIIEEKHWMTIWTPESWRKIISESNFLLHAQYDGDDPEYLPLKIGSFGNLIWHELIRK